MNELCTVNERSLISLLVLCEGGEELLLFDALVGHTQLHQGLAVAALVADLAIAVLLLVEQLTAFAVDALLILHAD